MSDENVIIHNNQPLKIVLELRNIYKTYFLGDQEVNAVNGIDLRVADGELLSIMGASGSGKTTTMNIIGLLDRPTSGDYFLDGKEVSKLSRNELAYIRNRNIGFIFQLYYLLPRMNAWQNVMLPLIYRDEPAKEMKRKALESLEKVGMIDYAEHRPSELSGGQQQRVAIARAIVGHPRFILADEPTGALDSKTGQGVMDLLKIINAEEKTTVIVVTHDINIAKQCQRIVTISDGEIIEEKTQRLPGFIPSKKREPKK